MRGTVWNRHGAPRNIEIQHVPATPSIAHSNSFGQNPTAKDTQEVFNIAAAAASNTSSEVPSRSSSVSNLRQDVITTQGPYLTQEKSKLLKEQNSSPSKTSHITPRYYFPEKKPCSTIPFF